MSYKDRLKDLVDNEYLIPAYASKKCRQCRGKGVIEMDINDGAQFTTYKVICECVRKSLREELKSVE